MAIHIHIKRKARTGWHDAIAEARWRRSHDDEDFSRYDVAQLQNFIKVVSVAAEADERRSQEWLNNSELYRSKADKKSFSEVWKADAKKKRARVEAAQRELDRR